MCWRERQTFLVPGHVKPTIAALQNGRASPGPARAVNGLSVYVARNSGRALNAYFPLELLNPVFSFSEAWGKIMFHILKINTAFTEV